ncbi:hypothetical protein [Geobacter sp. SVR]|uniref:hypothetical protein n=1 Tax=Geobacter sp. SVR TaxID=2495594 RepID=UPI00143EFBB2|nr:hypothetical protein [Geobacter sp. SVR]BCS54316.1 hypothetical protein GSVR_26240 [Geobacter sp. SVR]GCF85825.1 hypothetical protein GSbR_24250 [Geobacter sp. SVR]
MTLSHIAITSATAILAASVLLAVSAGPGHAEDACSPATAAAEQVVKLRQENEILNLRIRQSEANVFPEERLRRRKALRLKEMAADVRTQRQITADFEKFAAWMCTNLAGYNRYIQAGSHAAVLARFLPIPYAGQASVFTKFVSQFTVALNSASLSVNAYMASSQKLIAMSDAIDPAAPNEKSIADTAQFADRQFLKDMHEAQSRLAAVSDLSSGALSFLVALNNYVSGTDEYLNKLKGIIKKDVDPKEKSFLSENIGSLKGQADRFNGRLRTFEELNNKETAAVRSLAVYDELLVELKNTSL